MSWRLMAVLVLVVAAMGSPLSAPTAVAQDQSESLGDAQQLNVLEPTPIYSNSGDVIGEVSPGDSYTVLAIEDGAALVVGSAEASEPFWIELDYRVELVAATVPAEAPPPEGTLLPAGTPTPQPTANAQPIATAVAGTPPPTAAPTTTPNATRPGDPSAWSLTVNDLPSGFTLDSFETRDTPESTTYAANFNNHEGSIGRSGPFFVFNELGALKLPSGVSLRQEFVDEIADSYEFASVLDPGASERTSVINTGASTRVSGPTLGDLSRWQRASVTQSSRGVTVRIELHMVVFTVASDVAVLATVHIEGNGSQSDAASLANIVLGRMRG